MSNPKRTSRIAILIVSICLVAVAYWIKATPVASIPSKSTIGKLDLAQIGATLQVSFIAPERLSSVSLRFPNAVLGSENLSGHPTFPLALHLRVKADSGTNVWDELVEPDRMWWTNWHPDPSLALSIHGWLSERLVTNRVYVLTLTVDKPALGEAEVYLHWYDRAYLWGTKHQTLTIVPTK